MPRVIPAEATAFLTRTLGEDGAVGITVAGVEPTLRGPRVRFDVPRLSRPRADTAARAPDRALCAELVSRMVALRWLDSPQPRVPPEDSGLALSATYAEIYTVPPETSEGWHWLLAATAEWIREIGVPPGFKTDQVKQKFGTLRFYWHADAAENGAAQVNRTQVSNIIRTAEWVSGAVCEVCGAPGSIRPAGWIRTLCDAHDPRRAR